MTPNNRLKINFEDKLNIKKKFVDALHSYVSVERPNTEAAKTGNLIQGIVGLEVAGKTVIVPFHFADQAGIEQFLRKLGRFASTKFGVSFVKDYVHYA